MKPSPYPTPRVPTLRVAMLGAILFVLVAVAALTAQAAAQARLEIIEADASGAAGVELAYQVVVPPDTSELRIEMTGAGDADLYVRFGQAATLADWDCRPYLDVTSNESCTINQPQAGVWHVMIHGYRSFDNVRVTSTVIGAPLTPVLTNGQPFGGLSGTTGDVLRFQVQIPPGASNLVIRSTGSGDADLYVNPITPPELAVWDCRPYLDLTSTEECAWANPVPGTWHVMVHGYRPFSATSITASWTEDSAGPTATATPTATPIPTPTATPVPTPTATPTPTPTPTVESLGEWSSVIQTPLVPVAGSALPNGNVLLWSAYQPGNFGTNAGYTQTAIFDPTTMTSSARTVYNTGHDMFCPGIANLADGRIFVNGGANSRETSIYDPSSDQWINAPDMNIGRGYQGTALLSDGTVFTIGGSWSGGIGNKTAEVYTEGQGWRRLNGLPSAPLRTNDEAGEYRSDNHMWLFSWSNNTVFHAGPARQMHVLDANGNGSYSNAGVRGTDGDAMNGNAVMYAPGKILAIGGSPSYNNSLGTTNAHVIDINGIANGGTAEVRTVQSLNHRRTLHSSVVLPTGEVLVLGGQEYAKLFTDERAVLVPELWDPTSETFTELAPMDVPRTYHSMAVLLEDGRVLIGGGGLCGDCDTNHFDVQIFSPPYLFDGSGELATRPVIQTAPATATWGQQIGVRTNTAISEFSLVRLSSATHSVNNDQRRIPVSFSGSPANWNVSIPADSGVVTPGAYLLFAMDANGTPSVARTITIN